MKACKLAGGSRLRTSLRLRTSISAFDGCALAGAIALALAASGCTAPGKTTATPTRWDQARFSTTLQLAEEHIAAGKFDRACAALAAFPDFPDARLPLTLARIDVEQGHYGAALQRLDAVTPPNSERSTRARLRGIALEGLGRWGEAAAAYQVAYELEADADLLTAWLDALVLDGRAAAARAILERERHRFPGAPTIHLLAARLCEEAGDPAGALDELATAALAWPESLEVGRRLAEAYTAAGRHADAIETWQRLVVGSRGAEEGHRLRSQLAKSLMAAERFDEARRVFRAIVAVDPDDQTARLGLAAACLVLGEAAEALAAALEVLQADGSNADARVIAALSYRRLAQPAKARELLSGIPSGYELGGLARELRVRCD
jgi:tetratricopeptide (TPR) repeat protein